MDENRNLKKKSEELTKPKSKLPFHPIQGIKNFWYSLSPTGRDVVAGISAGGLMTGFVIGISKGYKSDLHIGDFFRWTFTPSDSDDDFDDD